MSYSTQILVVAPDLGLRKSLEFALEVEHFSVWPFESLLSALESADGTNAKCVIVDEEALLGDPFAMEALRRFNKPVLLLIDRSRPVPESRGLWLLRKPVLGNALIRAVRLTAAANVPDQST